MRPALIELRFTNKDNMGEIYLFDSACSAAEYKGPDEMKKQQQNDGFISFVLRCFSCKTVCGHLWHPEDHKFTMNQSLDEISVGLLCSFVYHQKQA